MVRRFRVSFVLAAALLMCMVVSANAEQALTDIGASLIPTQSSSIAWGDCNNDGSLDLVISGNDWNAYTTIYRNNGGVFTGGGAAEQVAGLTWSSTAWGDYDNDGNLELVVSGYKQSTPVCKIYKKDNSGIYVDVTSTVAPALPAIGAGSVAWGDYDNDGRLDLAVAGAKSSGNTAQILHNALQSDGSTLFTAITVSPALTSVKYCSLAWVDYDNDGDLDLALTGYNGTSQVFYIYRNDGSGTFVRQSPGITAVQRGSMAWADFDNDGDLDVAITGSTTASPFHPVCKLFQNNGGTFLETTGSSFTGVLSSSVAWGDYDSDGYADLAVSGCLSDNQTPSSTIYHNEGDGTFTVSPLSYPSIGTASVAWGDYNKDGCLDLGIAGVGAGSTYVSKILRNDGGVQNTAPSAPTGLYATRDSLTQMTFGWNASTDAETAASGLSYNLRVGTAPGSDDIFSGMSDTATGFRKIQAIGNAQKRLSWTVKGLDLRNKVYYWSVQAIDASYAGSAWAPEAKYTTPFNVSLSPNTGELAVGGRTTFTSGWADPEGYAHIRRAYLLINNNLVNKNGICLLYDSASSKLYLATDDGNGWTGGYAPGSDNVIQNSQCKLYCKDTEISGADKDLTINWSVEIKPAITGSKLIGYMRAEDFDRSIAGWAKMGTFSAAAQPPAVVGITPNSGSILANTKTSLRTEYSDPNSSNDIRTCYLMVNKSLVSTGGIYVLYQADSDKLWIMNDTGDGWTGGVTPGTDTVISNKYAKLYCKDTTVVRDGNSLVINWVVEAGSSLLGTRYTAFMRVEDRESQIAGWSRMGSFNITGSAPVNVSLSPNSGSISVGSTSVVESVYSDADGNSDISRCYLLINERCVPAGSISVLYDASADKLYLGDDLGGWQGGYAPGSDNTISNSQCVLHCKDTTIDRATNSITVRWAIEPSGSLAGKYYGAYLRVEDKEKALDTWERMGAFQF